MARRSGWRWRLLIGVLLTMGAAVTAFPFFWMVSTAVTPLRESRSVPPRLVTSHPTLASFQRLFTELHFGTYLVNTIIVVLISFVGLLLMAAAGYAFAKHKFRGKKFSFALVLGTMMIPAQVTMIPTYVLLNDLKLTNTLVGISLPSLVTAFNIFLFRQFMSEIPDEVLEAARLDGASELRTFWSIVLPMSRPVLAVVGVLTFISGWNSFLWPLVVANDQNKYTLSVGLSLLNKQQIVNPPLQMAGAALMVVPILIVFVAFQRHIVRGFTMSGLK